MTGKDMARPQADQAGQASPGANELSPPSGDHPSRSGDAYWAAKTVREMAQLGIIPDDHATRNAYFWTLIDVLADHPPGARDSDTRPKDGDGTAPLASSAGRRHRTTSPSTVPTPKESQ